MSADPNREFTPAELVRIHEANCNLDYTSDEEARFRVATMKHLAKKMGLPELKHQTITGNSTGNPRPSAADKK